jgi:hypothetical protein
MGRHARARVIRDFSEQRYVEGMYQLYQDLGVALPPTGN